MDALGTLSGSALETKAERIARYKAERRRELAERYANLEDTSTKYTRRERHRDNTDAPDMASSTGQKPKEVTDCTRGQPAEADNREEEENETEVQSETNKKQRSTPESRHGWAGIPLWILSFWYIVFLSCDATGQV